LMGVVTVLVVLQNLVVSPRKKALATAREQIEEFEAKVSRGVSALNRDRITRRDLQNNAQAILEIQKTHLPPDVSRYTWALGRITAIAHELGLLPPLIRDHAGQRYVQSRRPYAEVGDKASMWITYAIEVDFQASYHQLVQFLKRLHEDFPFASIGQLNVRTNPQSPEFHLISLLIEWPILRHAEDKALLEENRSMTP